MGIQRITHMLSTLALRDDPRVNITKIKTICSRRGKIKVPKEYPRFSANAIMIALWGTKEYLAKVYLALKTQQHTMFATIKPFKYFVGQGEYSEEEKPHLQAVIQAERKANISSVSLYKIFQPENPTALQVQKCRSIHDAIHYVQKPHNNCNCDNCEKARKCKTNWSAPVECGIAPIGKGQRSDWNLFNIEIAAKPTQKTCVEDHPHLFMRYHSAMEKTKDYYAEKKAIEDCQAPEIGIRDWEMSIHIQLYVWDPRDRRCIIWIFSRAIGTGKTEGADQICYYYGHQHVMTGMKSYKHMINAYRGEKIIRYNYPLYTPPNKSDFELLELLSDGGMAQGDMYNSRKKNVRAHIIVTANVPPPDEWRGPNGRLRCVIDLDAPKPAPPAVNPIHARVKRARELDAINQAVRAQKRRKLRCRSGLRARNPFGMYMSCIPDE